MGFSHLKEKVAQAEQALEANERVVASDWRVFKKSWRDAWTPGRIVIAGLASGFVFGRLEPVSKSKASSIVNMLTAVSGLFASGTAAGAADDAKKVATRVEAQVQPEEQVPPVEVDAVRVDTHEQLRRAGHL